MQYRRVGKWGLQVSELSLGSWITFGTALDGNKVKMIMKEAFDLGINFFDNAEVYGSGMSETLMGEALKEFPRNECVVSTKIFWGGNKPNTIGLSWKHLVEGTKSSLMRLGLDYVDLLYCHRPDPNTPIEETVLAMNHLIQSGHAFYWGTSEWSRDQIQEAHRLHEQFGYIPPIVEQPQYNLFHRYRVEKEYATLIRDYGMGLTIWSPLDSGILTGKYNEGISEGTRLAQHRWLQDHLNEFKIQKVKKLQALAQELGMSSSQLAIAWCLKNPHVSCVLLGVTSKEQLEQNIQASVLKDRLTDEVMKKIHNLFAVEKE